MTGKRLLTGLLLAFVIASIGVLLFRVPPRGAEPGSATAAPGAAPASATVFGGAREAVESPRAADRVVAYYFHGRFRCASCREIERLSAKAIREGFPEEIRSGRLAFRAVDVDRPENRHFVEEYRLSSQSLVIVAYRGDRRVRWDTLEKVWTLLGSETEFLSYVRSGISAYLTGA
ncbi:MAG: hypothetical protein Kow00128_01400 [Deltaproteobacteria bacterium]